MGWRAAQKVFQSWKVLRGDRVMVMAGKDKGLTGAVQRVIRAQNRVVITGRNLVAGCAQVKKHVKKTEGSPGGIITMEAPLHVSNVSLLDPVTGSPCRVSFRWLEDGTKVRVARGPASSGAIVPRPAILLERRKPLPLAVGARDTAKGAVLEVTYDPSTGLPPL
eukprot:SM000067S20377  [mRNA]  locus=s67:506786:508542:- [translate_table: standard]